MHTSKFEFTRNVGLFNFMLWTNEIVLRGFGKINRFYDIE